MLFCFAIILNTVQPFTQYIGKSSGTTADLIYSVEDMNNHIRQKYNKENVSDLKFKISSYKVLKSINIGQKDINRHYILTKGVNSKADKTCVEVASTILSYMYSTEKNDYNEIFCKILDYAKEKGYHNSDLGTNGNKVEKIIKQAFSLNNSTKDIKVKKKIKNVYDTLKENINNDKLTYFNITDHAMVGAGYIEYTVTWKQDFRFLFFKKTQEYECTEKFIVVNAGCSSKVLEDEFTFDCIGKDNVYQIYPEDRIKVDFMKAITLCFNYYNITFIN